MIDASISMQPRGTDRIDLGDGHGVRDWTLALAVGELELREVAGAVGSCPDRVRLYLELR